MDQTEKPKPATTPKRSRPGPSRQDKIVERRLSLLEATLRVIARKGLVAATMNDIASEAGCAYGVVAFHFKSKDGIMLAALDHMVEEYDRTLALTKIKTPEARLKAMINLDFDPAISDNSRIAVFTAFWAESARNPMYRERCAELKARYHDATVADVAELARSHGIKLDAGLVARSLNALIDGLWIAGQVLDSADAGGRRMAKKACIAYLRSIFPESF
jgi:AcrR family transcriptional regulator